MLTAWRARPGLELRLSCWQASRRHRSRFANVAVAGEIDRAAAKCDYNLAIVCQNPKQSSVSRITIIAIAVTVSSLAIRIGFAQPTTKSATQPATARAPAAERASTPAPTNPIAAARKAVAE